MSSSQPWELWGIGLTCQQETFLLHHKQKAKWGVFGVFLLINPFHIKDVSPLVFRISTRSFSKWKWSKHDRIKAPLIQTRRTIQHLQGARQEELQRSWGGCSLLLEQPCSLSPHSILGLGSAAVYRGRGGWVWQRSVCVCVCVCVWVSECTCTRAQLTQSEKCCMATVQRDTVMCTHVSSVFVCVEREWDREIVCLCLCVCVCVFGYLCVPHRQTLSWLCIVKRFYIIHVYTHAACKVEEVRDTLYVSHRRRINTSDHWNIPLMKVNKVNEPQETRSHPETPLFQWFLGLTVCQWAVFQQPEWYMWLLHPLCVPPSPPPRVFLPFSCQDGKLA